MGDELNAMMERLKFSEAEQEQVICDGISETNNMICEAWAVGKILAKEKINKEAMYRVLKSLWFTKEPVNFVSIPRDLFLVKFSKVVDRKGYFAYHLGCLTNAFFDGVICPRNEVR